MTAFNSAFTPKFEIVGDNFSLVRLAPRHARGHSTDRGKSIDACVNCLPAARAERSRSGDDAAHIYLHTYLVRRSVVRAEVRDHGQVYAGARRASCRHVSCCGPTYACTPARHSRAVCSSDSDSRPCVSATVYLRKCSSNSFHLTPHFLYNIHCIGNFYVSTQQQRRCKPLKWTPKKLLRWTDTVLQQCTCIIYYVPANDDCLTYICKRVKECL